MTLFLFFKYIGNLDEDSAFLHVAKQVVDCCSKHFHCGRQAHVGIDERWYVEAIFADAAVENLVVLGIACTGKDALHSFQIDGGLQRVDRRYQVFFIGKML